MNHTPISTKDHYIALSLGLLSGLCLSLVGAFGKHLTTFADLSVVIFIRFFVPFILICIPYLFFRKQKTHKINLTPYLFRAIFVVISQYCFFFLLSRGSLLLAVLLYSTSGIFSPFLARIFFRHQIKIKTFIAIIVGLIGVAITLGPMRHLSGLTIFIGLLSGLFGACSQITLHRTSKEEDPITINFFNYGFSSLLSLLLVFIMMPSFSKISIDVLLGWQGIVIILLFSIFSIGNKISRLLAYARINKAASLAPFLYSALVFSAFIDWIWLGIIPRWYTYVGIAIIILSGVIMTIRFPGKN